MHYAQNYLTNVILRLDFPQQDVLLKEDKPEFSADIAESFPVVTSQQLSQTQFTIQAGQAAGYNQQVIGYKWDHRDRKLPPI